jgi:NDP-sugar pyrophosphorylase family protein
LSWQSKLAARSHGVREYNEAKKDKSETKKRKQADYGTTSGIDRQNLVGERCVDGQRVRIKNGKGSYGRNEVMEKRTEEIHMQTKENYVTQYEAKRRKTKLRKGRRTTRITHNKTRKRKYRTPGKCDGQGADPHPTPHLLCLSLLPPAPLLRVATPTPPAYP